MGVQNNFIFLLIAIWTLCGCTETRSSSKLFNDIAKIDSFDERENSTEKALVYPEEQQVIHKCDKATIKANNLTLPQVAVLLSNLYNVNIAYTSNVGLSQSSESHDRSKADSSGLNPERVYLDIKDVCLIDVIDQLIETYNIGFDKSHYGYVVYPAQLRTKTFSLNYSSVMPKIQEDFWLGITESIKSILTINKSSSESFYVHKETGLVVVTAYPKQLHYIKKFIKEISDNSTSQVLIEVKIIEVHLHDRFVNGIEWNLVNSKLTDSILDKKSFNKVIEALSEQGQISILSSPLVITLNNQKATVKTGGNSYFVTNLTTETSGLTGSITNAPKQSEVGLQQIFSGAILEATPNILNKKEILLHIHPTINQISGKSNLVGLASKNDAIPTALTQLEELDTVVKANSGDIIIISGMTSKNTNKKKLMNNTELIFLIKPTIMGKSEYEIN